MSMIGFSFIELLVLVFLGGSPLSLPLSLPPLPEDPALAQAAPQECLWYLTWSGCAKPDPASKNHTEQLLAEQEIQRFVTELETRLRDAIKRGAPQGPQAAQAAVLAEEGPNLLKLLITRPAAFFVENAAINPGGLTIKGGVVVAAGDQAEAAKKSIERIVTILKLSPPSGETAKQTDAIALPMPQGAPRIDIRWHQSYLVIGVGDGATDEIIKRFGGKPPAWLARVRADLAVERPATIHFLNVRRVLAAALPLGGLDALKASTALGLDRLNHYASVSGLEGSGAVSRAVLSIDGELRGLFGLLEGAPLKADDLAAVPRDATFALVARFNAERALRRLIELVGQVDPRAKEQFQNELGTIDKQLGFRLMEDVFGSLGDRWCVYNSPGEGGLVFTGLTAVVPLKDRKKLMAAHDKVLAMTRAANAEAARLNGDSNDRGRRPDGVVISDFEFAGHMIHFLNFIGDEVPFAPAWCITDRELIVSLYPQMIKARLGRKVRGGSLADVPEVAQLFKGDRQPAALFYQDTRSVFRLAYPVLHVFAAFVAGQLQREGLDIDISLLPSMAAIEPHLQPGISALYLDNDGLRFESRQTLPGAGGVPLVLAGVGWFGFRVAAVRPQNFQEADFVVADAVAAPTAILDLEAITPAGAQRNVSEHNLKQIGLAMHNFHDTHRRFPVADGAGQDGKPKLSWRVHILPFVEQQTLFNQFKLDEPWDSEHNKKLIAKMPKLYATPGSKAAEKHMTNYLTVRGKDTAFPAGQATRISHLVDGTSNTALVLEVDDEHAVIWTRPDDFEPDKDEPLKGVVGLRNGKFLVLMGDAAVLALPNTLSKETVRALFTRGGGEPADFRN
jgi:hypothetical protein